MDHQDYGNHERSADRVEPVGQRGYGDHERSGGRVEGAERVDPQGHGGHQDHVDHIIDQWRDERPDLDCSPIEVIGRLHRVGDHVRREITALQAQHGLGEGEFDVLATLRRRGHPYRLTPRELADQTMVTSGAISKIVDRLEARGLVRRERSLRDGRSRVIVLTAQGRRTQDRAYEQHIALEHALVAGLDEADRAQLAALLKAWGTRLGVG